MHCIDAIFFVLSVKGILLFEVQEVIALQIKVFTLASLSFAD